MTKETPDYRQIIENRIAELRQEFETDADKKQIHLFGRLEEVYWKAVGKYAEEMTTYAAIGKFFAFEFIQFCQGCEIGTLHFLHIAGANNPERPTDGFLQDYGEELDHMKRELERVRKAIENNFDDYLAFYNDSDRMGFPGTFLGYSEFKNTDDAQGDELKRQADVLIAETKKRIGNSLAPPREI